MWLIHGKVFSALAKHVPLPCSAVVGPGAAGYQPRAVGAGREGLDSDGGTVGHLHLDDAVGEVVRARKSDVDVTFPTGDRMDGVHGGQPTRRAGGRRVLGELVLPGLRRRHQDEAAGRDLVGALGAGRADPPLVIVLGAP